MCNSENAEVLQDTPDLMAVDGLLMVNGYIWAS